MNKLKILFRKRTYLMIALSLAVAGVASAALVNYLSNSVNADATIGSSIVMNINEGRNGSENENTHININGTSNDDILFTTVAKNNSKQEIKGYRVIVVTAEDNKKFTGGEIDKVMVENALGTGDITDKLVVVYADGSIHWLKDWKGSSKKLVIITSDDGGNTATEAGLKAGETDWNTFTITPNKAIAPGNYNIFSQFVPDLAAFAATQY